MKSALAQKHPPVQPDAKKQDTMLLVKKSFERIAPFWPLKNLIAVNPLQGFEDMPVEEALKMASIYFQQPDLPGGMQAVNRETIKWMQAYFDEGQATLAMPGRKKGLYGAWRMLAIHDKRLHDGHKEKITFLQELPHNPEQTIRDCLQRLGIDETSQEQFMTLTLTTLPGWASLVKQRTEWAGLDKQPLHPVTQAEYLAVRLASTCVLWPEGKLLLEWHHTAPQTTSPAWLRKIEEAEKSYRLPLLQQIARQEVRPLTAPKAQLVFCIDVRSEPFRKALERAGDYQTFGFAGFFGIPVHVSNAVTGESYASCPVLLTPKYNIIEKPCAGQECSSTSRASAAGSLFKRVYQSVKYTFTTPFALAEGLGLFSGGWMALRSLAPGLSARIQDKASAAFNPACDVEPVLDSIPLAEQSACAEGALRMMGLTDGFAPLVVLCGHGSTTKNNAYATALDCGACGGRHGGSNARIMAAILNRPEVRSRLAHNGISIPDKTRFIAAEHDTTTDQVSLYGDISGCDVEALRQDLEKARATNSSARMERLGMANGTAADTLLRSQDWAQVRPEWGLARNAAFIVAPRGLTAGIDLEGRCFLHSYDYTKDPDGKALETILTAPMVVAEWISTQYLFSTLDNVAYGGGSKITKNITGKTGIMQGNASDLMTGLPLQSVNASDEKSYHEAQRLMCVVYAPWHMIDSVVDKHPVLKKLFGNGWVQLACIEPDSRKIYLLTRDFSWRSVN